MGQKTKANLYISRIESGSTRGWWVRIRAGDPRGFQRFFSDLRHGGKAAARAAAREVRDSEVNKRPFLRTRTKAAPWGRGVSLNIDRRGVRPRLNWVAYWSRDGRQYQKSFSVDRYGYDQALDLAIQHREFMTAGALPD